MTEPTYIKNEKEIIESDFYQSYYYLIALEGILKPLSYKMQETIKKAKDYQALKYYNKLEIHIKNLSFALEQFKESFKAEDRKKREEVIIKIKEIVELISIPIVRIPIEQHNDFVNFIMSYFQGEYTTVQPDVIESLLDYEQPNTLEGLSLISRYCPDMPVHKKEQFAKDMVMWSDFRKQISNK